MLRYTPSTQKQVPYKGLFPQTLSDTGEWLDREDMGSSLDTTLTGGHLLGGSSHIRMVLCGTSGLEA